MQRMAGTIGCFWSMFVNTISIFTGCIMIAGFISSFWWLHQGRRVVSRTSMSCAHGVLRVLIVIVCCHSFAVRGGLAVSNGPISFVSLGVACRESWHRNMFLPTYDCTVQDSFNVAHMCVDLAAVGCYGGRCRNGLCPRLCSRRKRFGVKRGVGYRLMAIYTCYTAFVQFILRA